MIAVVVSAVLLALFFGRAEEGLGPGLVSTVIGTLLVWRRIRNRRLRLARRFASKVRKMAEVGSVALDGMRLHIVATRRRHAPTCAPNAALDAVNGSMFFGEPFHAVVRDAVQPDEEKALLAASGSPVHAGAAKLAAAG